MQADTLQFSEMKYKTGHVVWLVCFVIMCTRVRRNETGMYNGEEIFVYFAQLSNRPTDKLYFVLLEADVSLSWTCHFVDVAFKIAVTTMYFIEYGYSYITEHVLMNNEMQNSYNQFFIPHFFVCSTCFERV